MANISNYLEEKILNHVMRNVALTSPSTVYVGIISDDAIDADLEAGTLTNEITGYDGDRKPVVFTEPEQVESGTAVLTSKATIKNNSDIDFENMPASTVKYAIVCDAPTNGNILYWCPLAGGTKNTNAGDIFRIPEDGLILDLD